MDSRKIAFTALISALGLLLSTISLNIAPIFTAVGQSGAALDLSHIATFIAAIFGGPALGAVVGFISGIYAGYYFGYVVGSLGLLSLIGVPSGKALTGLTAGLLYKALHISSRSRPSAPTVLVVLVSYVPECLFTVAYFRFLVPFFYGSIMEFMIPIVISKAWVEIFVMSLLMGALNGNSGFKEFVARFLGTQKPVASIPKSGQHG